MKHYKKRTIALCLASLLTVAGAFGAENYNNRLMSLGLSNYANTINITAFTEKPYNTPLKTIQEGSDTYTIILPEMDSTASIPNIINCPNIESVNISTLPYTYEQQGYTKVTLKTRGTPRLEANSTLFLSDLKNSDQMNTNSYKPVQKQKSYWDFHENNTKSSSSSSETYNYKEPVKTSVPTAYQTDNNTEKSVTKEVTKTNNVQKSNYKNTASYGSKEPTVAIICGSLLLLIIGFIILIGKDKMASVVGEQNKIDLSDDNDDSKQNSKRKQIRKTINSLDKKYSNKTGSFYSGSDNDTKSEYTVINKEEKEEEEKITVINLDDLYQKKTQTANNTQSDNQNQEEKEEDTDDLADFLNEFTFNDEISEEMSEKSDENLFDEELYQQVINNTDLKFTPADIERLNQLLKLEISSETQNSLVEHIKAERTKPRPITKTQILENLVTTYSIKQNITFSNDDILTIKKLMDVELDKDFITDLRTKPGRTKEAEKEIKAPKKQKTKKSDIITLNVKDLLPDLSKELKKQGNKKIESEVKPEVVYFSEGYEYTTLSVSDELDDIATALKSADATEHKESYFAPIVETGYEVSTLAIKDELPDLEDVKANPKKYEKKEPKKAKVDENALLKSIANVTFKPFYEEETHENFIDLDKIKENAHSEDIISIYESKDFESLFTEEEKEEEAIVKEEVVVKEEEKEDITEELNEKITEDIVKTEEPEIIDLIQIQQIAEQIPPRRAKINDDAAQLLKLIEEQQLARKNKKQEEITAFKQELETATTIKQEKEETKVSEQPKIKLTDTNNELLKTIIINQNTECSLVKTDNGYEIIGCINDKQFNLKHYDSLKNTNMQIRAHQKNKQYLIKLGIHKFVINITTDNMEFVMDLC